MKLRKVRRKYGADGYAIYWFCLEAIAYDVDKDNLTFELKEDCETIGFELDIQERRVEEIIKYMVNIGLFESSNNLITCLKLAESIDKSMTNSPKMRTWLGSNKLVKSKSVMTSDDNASICPELEVEKEKEKELDKDKDNKKDLSASPPLISEKQQQINDVFEFWKKTMGKKEELKITKGRLDKIKARFKDGYSADDMKKAIEGCARSPHHMGKNDRATVYDDLTLILRNAEKVDQFMGYASQNALQSDPQADINDWINSGNENQEEQLDAFGAVYEHE